MKGLRVSKSVPNEWNVMQGLSSDVFEFDCMGDTGKVRSYWEGQNCANDRRYSALVVELRDSFKVKIGETLIRCFEFLTSCMAYLRIRPDNLPWRWKFRRLKSSALSQKLEVQIVQLSFYLSFKIFVSGMLNAWNPFKYNLISIRENTNYNRFVNVYWKQRSKKKNWHIEYALLMNFFLNSLIRLIIFLHTAFEVHTAA